MFKKIVLFGEAEKGKFCFPYHCKSLIQLVESLGNPPPKSLGIYYAIKTILYQQELLFFRVEEEGFSLKDYLNGLNLLKNKEIKNLTAICIPGVGDTQIINAAIPICQIHKSLLIITEKDLFDYLTS